MQRMASPLIALFLACGGNAFGADAPQISRSVGEPGGVVVLWPRVLPATDAPEIRAAATRVQQSLQQLVASELAGRPVDVRPEPERVCPQAGCKAASVGALLVHAGQACAVVGWVSQPGRSPARLVPWAGKIRLKQPTVPFRDYPESYVTILDFQPCAELEVAMASGQGAVGAAIRGLAPAPTP